MQNESNNGAPVFLGNEEIMLCPLEENHAEGGYPAWLNDAEVCAGNSHHRYPYTIGEAREYIASCAGRRDRIVLAIVERASSLHVGNVALQQIDLVSRSAELAIMIGEKSAWGKGYGKAACRLLVEHAFNELNLERVHCGTFENNTGMIGIARALGMVEEGRRRQAIFKSGRYLDLVEFGLLRKEYRADQGQKRVG